MLKFEKVGGGGRLLLLIHGLLTLGIGLSNIFVNIYLWRISKNLQVLALFNFFLYSVVPFTFVLAGWVARNYDRLWCIRIGVVIHTLFYLIVLILKKDTVNYIIPLGMFKGLGVGFYHLAEHILVFDLTKDKTRDFFNGINGFFAGFFGMIAPFISGLIIKNMPDLTGYTIIFSTTMLLFIGVEVLSFFIHPRCCPGPFYIWKVLKNPDPNWRRILGMIAFYGFRTGIFTFLTALLVFLACGNEFILGSFSLFMGGLTLLSALLLAYLVKPKKRALFIHISAVMLIGALGALIWRNDWMGILIFGILTGFFDPFFDIPFESLSFKVIENDTLDNDLQIEYIVARELPLNLGRVLSIFLFYLLLGREMDVLQLRIYLAFLIPAPIIISFLLRGIRLSE
ncbi:MAG: MFS transporter [Halanaerobiales bacterium]|nr:MFS transporter [Halanaerobiales bacterium]